MRLELLGEYMAQLSGITGLLGCCVLEQETGRLLVASAQLAPELEARLVAGGAVLRAHHDAAAELGLGDRPEDVVISQAHEYHVLRAIQSTPGLCCVLALAREGSNLAGARRALVEAEEVFKRA
jgi:hypothetical protein